MHPNHTHFKRVQSIYAHNYYDILNYQIYICRNFEETQNKHSKINFKWKI